MRFWRSALRALSSIVAWATIAAPFPSKAGQWSGELSTGGYLGRYAIGVGYNSENQRHHTVFSRGLTPDRFIGDIEQFNLIYNYSLWNHRFSEKWFARFADVGPFLLYTTNDHFFIDDAEHDVDKVGYGPTALRAGLMWGGRLGYEVYDHLLWAGMFLAVTDQGLEQLYNNGWRDTIGSFVSQGFTLTVEF